MFRLRKLHKVQSGMVAIVVTTIIILVLTLIILAFSNLTRREERQALDRQLNTNAFYAAESGINDAVDALRRAAPNDAILRNDDTNCDPPAGYSNNIDGVNTQYSCLMIDPTPKSLEFSSVSKGTSKAFPLAPANNGSVGTTSVFWSEANVGNPVFTSCPASGSFPANWPANCNAPILRLDVVWVSNNFFLRDSLLGSTATIFAVPVTNGGVGTVAWSAAAGFGNQGQVIPVQCVANNALSPNYPRNCRLQITGMNNNPNESFYVRVMPIYKSAAVTMCVPACDNTARELRGAQASVDSTGKAADVLRRIQVRVNISDIEGPYPNYAIESRDTICKRFGIAPPAGVFADGSSAACAIN